MRKLLIVFSIALVFVGCNGNENKVLLGKIENLSKTLDSIDGIALNNEIDTLAALKVATNLVELRIKNNYNLDSIDYEFGRKMDRYKVMRRSLGPLGKTFSEIKNGIKEERISLMNLKNDISNNVGIQEDYESNYWFEKEKVKQLQVLLESYLIEENKTMTTFNELHKELDSFSMELLRQNQPIKSKNLR
jgi:hypothetical protein